MIFSSATLFVLFSRVCHGLVETCEELQAAFDLTKTQDVVVEMHPFQRIECAEFTTMSIDSNSLTVQSSEDLEHFAGSSHLREVRFEVTNGAKVTWETNVEFRGTDGQDVDGGGIFIGEGSTVRFLNDLEMTNVGVRSVTDESSDFASYERSGGCVYTDGYLRVDGAAVFTNCDVVGGGESSPGPGGALYVGEQGSVLFNGALGISDVSIIDDEGDDGGGIYNRGKVNIKGDAVFESLRARDGGAIYNAGNAQFQFKQQATAVFLDCSAHDGTAGALYNRGYFKFSGPALFYDTDHPSVYMSSKGETVLSKGSVFWSIGDTSRPAVEVASGGEFEIPRSVSFIGYDDADCTVDYVGDGTCQ